MSKTVTKNYKFNLLAKVIGISKLKEMLGQVESIQKSSENIEKPWLNTVKAMKIAKENSKNMEKPWLKTVESVKKIKTESEKIKEEYENLFAVTSKYGGELDEIRKQTASIVDTWVDLKKAGFDIEALEIWDEDERAKVEKYNDEVRETYQIFAKEILPAYKKAEKASSDFFEANKDIISPKKIEQAVETIVPKAKGKVEETIGGGKEGEKTRGKLKKWADTMKGKMGGLKKQLIGQRKAWIAMSAAATGALVWIISSTPALNAQLSLIKLNFKLLGMEIGNELTPLLQPLIDLVIDLINWLKDLDPELLGIAGLFIVVAGAVGVLSLALWALAANPVVLLIIAVAAGITAVIILVKDWESITVKLRKAFDKGNPVVRILIGLLLMMFSPLIIIAGIIKLIIDYWPEILAGAKKAINWITDGVGGLSDKWTKFKDNLTKTKSWLAPFAALFDNLLIKPIKDLFGGLWDFIKGIFTGIGDFIISVMEGNVSGMWIAIKGLIKTVVIAFGNLVDLMWLPIRAVFAALGTLDIIPDNIQDMLIKVGDFDVSDYLGTLMTDAGFAKGTEGLPSDMVIQAHKGEIIVPPGISADVRAGKAMIGGRGGTGGGRSLTVSPTIYLTVTGTGNDEEIARRASEIIINDMEKLVSRQ